VFGFVVRKTFYDLWDEFLPIALTNLGAMVLIFGAVRLALIVPGEGATLAAIAAGSLVCVLYFTAAAKSVAHISDYSRYGFRQFWAALTASLPAGLLCWGLLAVAVVLAAVAIPFYMRQGSLVWFAVAIMLFYVLVLLVPVLVFLPAGLTRLEGGLGKKLRRTLAFVFDNLGFCFAAALCAVLFLVISVVLGFLWPGPAGALLFIDEAMRLRLLKYDWLLANPGSSKPATRRRIPWRQLLAEEREMTGTRTWRNFIFPWKD
jgi:hypothetical protein